VKRFDSGMPSSLRSGSAAAGHVTQGQRRDSQSTCVTVAPSWWIVTTKKWKSSSSADTTTPSSWDHTRRRRR
jgi:hypothetical protein